MAGRLLYPQGPLIIVDKSMRRRQAPGSKVSLGDDDERDIKISVFDVTKTRRQLRANEPPTGLNNRSTCKQKIRFIQTLDAEGKPIKRRISRKASATTSTLTHSKSSETTVSDRPNDRVASFASNAHSTPTSSTHSDPLSVMAPQGSTLSLYARDHGIKAESLSILPFFLDTSKFFYPMQDVLPLAYDPVSMIYLPEGLTDDCCLTAILYTTSGQIGRESLRLTEEGSALYQHSLSKLRKRISTGCVKDHTICAVTILALYEHRQGEGQDSEAHLNGLINLIKARGGLAALDKRIHTKVYRTLLTPAIDRLEKPCFSQLIRNYPSLTKSLGASSPEIFRQSADLFRHDLHPVVLNGLLQLLRLAEAINHAIAGDLKVDPFSLDEDIMCIQHQLLALDATECSDLDMACKLAMLIFTKILCREKPFERAHSTPVAVAIQQVCQSLSANSQSDDLGLWIAVLGALAAQHTDEALWFLDEVEFRCHAKGISTLQHLLQYLGRVVWIPVVLSPHVSNGVLGRRLIQAWRVDAKSAFLI